MFRDLPAHAAVKDTGLPWAPTIPDHWAVKRAKTIMRAIDIRSETGEEELLTVSSSRGVVPRASANVKMFKAESYIGHKLCWPDDLVINSLWAWGRGLGVAKNHGIVSTAYGVYRQHKQALLPVYLHQLVRSEPFNWELQVRSQGVWKSRLQMTDDRWLDAPLLFPPLEEQAAIVKYLAHANARIDNAIAAKRRLISLLDELYRSMIAAKLTPQAGDQWVQTALKRVLSTPITDGPHETPDFLDSGVPFVSAEAAHHGRINLDDCRGYISESLHQAYCKKLHPRRDDIFIVKSGSTTGKTVIVDIDEEFSVWSPLALVRTGPRVIAKFMFYLLTSEWFQSQVRDSWSFGTQPNIGMGVLKDLQVRFPPVDVQERLVREIEEEKMALDHDLSLLREQIALLEEFRTHLVSDVVTGQVDVRAIAATLPEAAEVVAGAGASASEFIDVEDESEVGA